MSTDCWENKINVNEIYATIVFRFTNDEDKSGVLVYFVRILKFYVFVFVQNG